MVKAEWNNAVIAESTETQIVEGNHYFPLSCVDQSLLVDSDHRSSCIWKGTAHYYHIEVDGQRKENAAWYYPNPRSKVANIKAHVAFWKGVRVTAPQS